MASLSTMKAQSECSKVVWVVRMELYGSTTAVATYQVEKTDLMSRRCYFKVSQTIVAVPDP
jgi:hypothetical protein